MNVDTEITTSGSEPSSSYPKRHDILWFPDGNVVLQTDTHLFRVHKSVLSLHSSVFKGMFELPTVGDEIMVESAAGMKPMAETYEGVPRVAMAGDKGEDVAHLLLTVYDHGYYLSSSDDHPLSKIIALLLLSTKYDFRSIRLDVVRHLLKHYPTTLSEFDVVDDDGASSFQGARYKHHFKLLKAALVAEVDILLPGLFYASSDFDLSEISIFLGKTLDEGNLWRFLQGREKLGVAIRRIQSIYITESESCMKSHSSEYSFEKLRLKDPDPASYFDDFILSDKSGKKLVENWPRRVCSACRSHVVEVIDEEREKVWEELPSYFGLPKWDVLRAKLE